MDSESGREVLDSIKRTLKILVTATVILYIIVIGVAGISYREGAKARDALCTLRQGIETQVSDTNKFLTEHPQGFAGIPAQQIREGVKKQETAVQALSGLSC